MMSTLYQLADEYSELFRAVEQCEDVDELGLLLAKLNGADQELVAKIDSIASIVNYCEHMSKVADAEVARLIDRKNAFANKAGRIKAWMLDFLVESGREKVVGDRFTVSTRKCPASVEVVDQEGIPPEFWRTVTSNQIDKAKILEQWKETKETPPGVNVISNRKSLQIK